MNRSIHPDIAAVFAEPERIRELPAEMIPVMLTQLAVEQNRLSEIERRLLARLITDTTRNFPEGDRLLTAEQAAELLNTTKDWLRRHGSRLPFTVRLSDGQVRYSSKGIQRFITTRMGR